MKKFVRNTIGAFMALSLVAGAISCSDGLDDDDPFVKAGVVTNPNSNAGGNGGSGNGGSGSGVAATGSFDMPENEYDKGNTQYKGSTGIASLKVGDKVKMTFKGKASKTFKGEFFIVDTTEAANYWTELADKYEAGEVPVNFELEHEFEIKTAPKGTGDASTFFAVVGKDDATTVHIDYTELKFVLNGEETPAPAGNQENQDEQPASGDPAANPEGGDTPAPAADDHGLLSDAVDLAWDAGATVEAAKLADATDTSKFVVTYTSNNDNDYHTFKMRVVKPEQELFEGKEEGITINRTSTKADDLHGCSFVKAPAATANTFSYQPSAAEWAKLKTGGFNIYGYGAKVTKIVLEAGEQSAEPAPQGNEGEQTNTPSGEGEGNQDQQGGAGAPIADPNVIYSGTNVTLSIPQNFYAGVNHGISLRDTVANLGINLPTPKNGDSYTIYMKGTADHYEALGNMCVGFETDYDWQNCAMDGSFDLSEAKLTAGTSKDVTFNGTADGDWYFWFYDGDTDANAEPVTLTLSEFKITKKVSE